MNVKQIARWTGVAVSVASVLFAFLTHLGVWNNWRGDNFLAEVSTRFDSSYSQDAGRPVRPGDSAWPIVMRVIAKYSHAKLLAGREPRVFARFVAVASARNEAAHSEWTAPTTPVALLYKEWPGHGPVPPEDFVIVGTIGDLHAWIQRDESDFDFFIRTIFSACCPLASLCSWRCLKRRPHRTRPLPWCLAWLRRSVRLQMSNPTLSTKKTIPLRPRETAAPAHADQPAQQSKSARQSELRIG